MAKICVKQSVVLNFRSNIGGNDMDLENKTLKIDEEAWSMNDIKEYVKSWVTYEEEIKAIRESRNEWSKEFLDTHNIPKKELKQAMQIVKNDLDKGLIDTIIENIEGIVG